MLGPDHAASLEFSTFKEMVDLCKKVFISLGSSNKKFLASEKVLHNVLIRKFVARNDIIKNKKLNFNNIKTALIYKKSGILPKDYYKILGKRVKKFLKKGQIINLKDLKQ